MKSNSYSLLLRLFIVSLITISSNISNCVSAANETNNLPTIPEIPQTPQTIEKLDQIEIDGKKLLEKREFEKALTKFQEGYGLSLEMKFDDGQGRFLTHMCELYLERGQAVKAKELGENAIEILSNSGDKKSLGKARVALAQAYYALDNPKWAADQLDLALKTFTQYGITDSPEAAKVMTLAGNILLKIGKIKEAVQFYQGAATYYEQAGNYDTAVTGRIALSTLMREMGWFVAALEEANKAVTESKQTKDKALMPSAIAALAISQYDLNEFANARRNYEQLLGLKSSNSLSIARLENGYGQTIAATGDIENARLMLEKSLSVIKTEGTTLEQAQITNLLGCLEEVQGQHAQAIQHLNHALELVSLVQPKQDKFTIIVLQNLAAAEFRSNSFANAKNHLLITLPIFKRLSNQLLEARTLTSLGNVYMSMQDFVSAEHYIKQGLTLSEKIKDDASLWRDYTMMAEIQVSQGLVAQAKDSLNSALSFFRSPQAGWFACPDQFGFVSSREDFGYKLVSLLVSQDQLDSALLAAEQLKEESFINEWLRRGGEVKQEDQDIYNDLVTQRAHLHAAESTTTPDQLMKDWQNWLSRFKALSASNRALARLIAPIPTSAQDMIKSVKANHVTVIDYLVGPRATTIFTIEPSGNIRACNQTLNKTLLEKQVTSLVTPGNNNATQNNQIERKTLQDLYKELLPESVFEAIPDNVDQIVIIIPDKMLFNLPFAALVDRAGKYLIEEHTISLAPSIGFLLDSPPPYSHELSVVVATDNPPPISTEKTGEQKEASTKDAATKKDTDAKKEADAKSASAKDLSAEVNQITELFQPNQASKLTGDQADIDNLQEQTRGKSVLHIASDLSLLDGNPLRMELPLFLKNADNKEPKNKATADRLFGMNLPSDLVVLSGTAINLKDTQGNAVRLFSRGFGYAGVRNILMSLWVEPGQDRTIILVEFYKGSLTGLNEAQSLRKAQLLAMSKDPSVRAWASFQLLGPGF